MDKTVLISGGSGFLGINMVRHLLGQGGMKVRVLDIADFDYPEADRIGFIKGDIRDRETVARAMEGVQWVIHTAAARRLLKAATSSPPRSRARGYARGGAHGGVERLSTSSTPFTIPDTIRCWRTTSSTASAPTVSQDRPRGRLPRSNREKGMSFPFLPPVLHRPERLGVSRCSTTGSGRPQLPDIGSGNNR